MQATTQRFRPLCGPFRKGEEKLLGTVETYLRESGARILTAPERDGTTIFRLRSECEDKTETARRLKRRA